MLWDLERMIQLVKRGKVTWANKVWWFRKAPRWAGKGGWKYLSSYQLEAALALARTAYDAATVWKTGEKVGLAPSGLPVIAQLVKEKLTGQNPTKLSKKEYRRQRAAKKHEAAEANIRAMAEALEKRVRLKRG